MLVWLVLIIFLLAVTSIVTPGVFPYRYFVDKLDNGLTVITIPMESERLVFYYTIVTSGTRHEWEPEHSGFAHLFEHIMFRGTKKFPGNMY
ncbi:MAG: insulinase family protein, partial [Candidatus Neomarinimicrobiota bacterium]